MFTVGEIARSLHRSPQWVRSVVERLDLPLPADKVGYSTAYRIFLRTVSYLDALGVSVERIAKLSGLERHLLRVLCADSSGSRTWFIDQCGQRSARSRRLLLTNYDIGVELSERGMQLGLDFTSPEDELFKPRAMGVDALKALDDYLAEYRVLRRMLVHEVPRVRAAAAWADRLP